MIQKHAKGEGPIRRSPHFLSEGDSRCSFKLGTLAPI